MRNTVIAFAILALLLFAAACGGKKPAETASPPGLAEGEGVTVEDDTTITEDDVEVVDEGVGIDEGGIDERSILDMTLEEINAAEFLKNIYFDFDKYNLRDDAIAQLDLNANWIRQNGTVRLIIEGHCDERGTDEYNLALGERRAKAARDYLVRVGIAANRMMIVSYGESRPLDARSNEVAWSKNRRAHFRVFER
jgi:peptidoglycan-associated lipoprotein